MKVQGGQYNAEYSMQFICIYRVKCTVVAEWVVELQYFAVRFGVKMDKTELPVRRRASRTFEQERRHMLKSHMPQMKQNKGKKYDPT